MTIADLPAGEIESADSSVPTRKPQTWHGVVQVLFLGVYGLYGLGFRV